MSDQAFDQLGEAPETDASHAAWAAGIARRVQEIAEQIREHVEMLEGEVNMGEQVTSSLTDAADHFDDAATALTAHAQDYATTYEGVRETAEATGGKIPGMDPNNGYWNETA